MKYVYKNVLITGDNPYILNSIWKIIKKKKLTNLIEFDFTYTDKYSDKFSGMPYIWKIDMTKDLEYILNTYDLIISAHCKQIFPSNLVKEIKCINIHPGYNPYNRGWYPHVFSIINGLPAGATIHEMDKRIDNGNIIIQRKIKVKSYDTSETLYKRILKLEIKLFKKIIKDLLKNAYTAHKPQKEGNINYKQDYNNLKELNLNTQYTAKEMINLLRAMSHEKHKNLYFIDEQGNKVYLKLRLEKSKKLM